MKIKIVKKASFWWGRPERSISLEADSIEDLKALLELAQNKINV